MHVDAVFLLGAAACGLGLSLATYRFFALRNGWAMGEWHRHRPGLPIAIGVVAIVWSVMIALGRGGTAIWAIPLFGVIGAALWTGVLKVGSQVSLFLAPLATVLLALAWIIIETPKNVNFGAAGPHPVSLASDHPLPGNDPAELATKERSR